jgi:hypothetical protein
LTRFAPGRHDEGSATARGGRRLRVADTPDRDVVARMFELAAEGRQKDLPKYMHSDLKVRAFLPSKPGDF